MLQIVKNKEDYNIFTDQFGKVTAKLKAFPEFESLRDKIINAGAENCLFLVPMRPVRTYFGLISLTSSSDPEFIIPAKISEERYKVVDNYKITLKSTLDGFGKESYYLSDLEGMVESGTIQFYIKSK